MKTKTIRQTIELNVSPENFYAAFLSSKIHGKFTGSAAGISNKIGGAFEVYDGYATGKNLELIEGKKIIQSWRAADWPADIESTIEIKISTCTAGCRIRFTHKNVPFQFAAAIAGGWYEYYWNPLKKFFSK
jgi:activator of HSP90 ATPase